MNVVKKYLGEKRRVGNGTIDDLDATYTELPRLLQQSGFSAPKIETITIDKTWTSDSWIGYLYSTAFCRPAYFGDRLAEFEQEMRKTLLSLFPSDKFIEQIPVDVYQIIQNINPQTQQAYQQLLNLGIAKEHAQSSSPENGSDTAQPATTKSQAATPNYHKQNGPPNPTNNTQKH